VLTVSGKLQHGWVMRARGGQDGYYLKNSRERHQDAFGYVLSHSGLKTERKFTADVFIQHHGVVQPLTATPRLIMPPFGLQTTCTDRHCASEMQPA